MSVVASVIARVSVGVSVEIHPAGRVGVTSFTVLFVSMMTL
jgi:hypothetical protein